MSLERHAAVKSDSKVHYFKDSINMVGSDTVDEVILLLRFAFLDIGSGKGLLTIQRKIDQT